MFASQIIPFSSGTEVIFASSIEREKGVKNPGRTLLAKCLLLTDGGESFRNADVEAAALSSITPLIIARPWPQHLADRNYNFTPAAVTRREICQLSPRQYFTSLFHRAKCRTCAKIYHCYCCFRF